MRPSQFTKHEGDVRYRAEQLLKAVSHIDPRDVSPSQPLTIWVDVGAHGVPLVEKVQIIARDSIGARYLMVA